MSDGAVWTEWAWMAGAVAVRVLWQGALVGLAGGLLLMLLRNRTPQERYTVACAVLVAMGALLVVNAALLERPALPVAGAETGGAWLDSDSPAVSFSTGAGDSAPVPTVVTAEALLPTAPVEYARTSERPRIPIEAWYVAALPWIGRGWLAGLLVLAAYDVMGLLALSRLRHRATPAPLELQRIAASTGNRMGVGMPVPVRVLDDLSSAVVTGLFRVVILVPGVMVTGMAPEAVEAILAHEFAHIRRWDRWVNVFQRFLEVLLFFHPVVWWISRRIRAERELCCDVMALDCGADRVAYVRALLTFAERAQATPTLVLSSQGGNLSRRVRAILQGSGSPERTMRRSGAGVATLAFLVGLVALASLVSSLGHAEDVAERVLRFPSDRAVGTLYGRWADQDYRKLPWMPDFNEGWTALGAAQGNVRIPANTVIKLTLGTTSLGFLEQLEPDDLFYLDCRYQKLSDADLAPVAGLTGLHALDLSDSATLSCAALRELGTLRDLEWLDLSRISANGLPAGAFAKYPKLKFLSGHFREFSSDVVAQASALAELEYLCVKTGIVTVEVLQGLSGKQSLHGLVLDNTGLTDDAFGVLESLPKLDYLDVRKNPLTDGALTSIQEFTSLKYLGMENTEISDVGVEQLRDHPTLQQVFLSNTAVTEACLHSLATLPSLQTVKLVETGVSDEQAGAFVATLNQRPDNRILPQRSSNPDAPRVGLVMSHFTATGPHMISRPYGYSVQDSDDIARFLNESNFDVYAVVEPGTEILGELPGILHRHGLTQKVIDGYAPDALATLDVLFVSTLCNGRPSLLRAIDMAIQHGMGLVNVGLFASNPPDRIVDASAERIMAIPSYEYIWRGHTETTCPVLISHPILGSFRPGDDFVLKPLDGYRSQTGLPRDATILLGTPPEFPETFPVLYVRNHGQGRVVRAQWHRVHQPGIPFPGFSFYVRCINWAAGRDADTLW